MTRGKVVGGKSENLGCSCCCSYLDVFLRKVLCLWQSTICRTREDAMKWVDVFKAAAKINCDEALPVAKYNAPGKEPKPDAEAVILCKDKVRAGKPDDECDVKSCPRFYE